MNVADLIRWRWACGYRADIDRDGYQLGLAVEGGGMRGIVSGAMLIALHDLDLGRVFDGLYGTSSGALNLASHLTGQGWRALALYERLAYSEFYRLTRVIKGQRPVSIDVVFERIDDTLQIDYDEALTAVASRRFGIGLSRIDQPAAVVWTEFESGAQLRQVLRASAWLPILAGIPQPIGVGTYVDGGLYFANPFYVAMADGCTHVLQLSTRNMKLPAQPMTLERRYVARHLEHWTKGAGHLYTQMRYDYYYDAQCLQYDDRTLDNIHILRIACAEGAHQIDRMTMQRRLLVAGADAGYARIGQMWHTMQHRPAPNHTGGKSVLQYV